ncbi:MAG: TerB family tellurite resistance protein [Bacteroidales bacterium]|nr:TerB family tellurite resistance protein [Bacteroidales bacterium]
MGLFNKPKMQFAEDEAILYLLFACMEIDGKVTQEELKDLGFQLNRIKSIQQKDPDMAYDNFHKLLGKDAENLKKIIDTAASVIPAEKRLAVFSYCLQTMFSDGEFSDSEQTMVNYLVLGLGLEDTQAAHAITIMSKRFIL